MRCILIAEFEVDDSGYLILTAREDLSLKDIEWLVKNRLEEDEYDSIKLSVEKVRVYEKTEATRFTYNIYE